MIEHGTYDAPSGREAMLRAGPTDGSPVLILPPLFEEANRTRLFLVTVMRRLASGGIASVLPDLPGCNDSPIATVDARFEDWQAAVATLASAIGIRATIAVRAGALLDNQAGAVPHWRLAPEHGARVLRDMVRSTAMGGGVKAVAIEAQIAVEPTRLAGNLVHPDLYRTLSTATIDGIARTVRIVGDAGPADARIEGAPVWRRAEPGSDPRLVDAVIADLLAWLE